MNDHGTEPRAKRSPARLSPAVRSELWRRMYAPLLVGVVLLGAAGAGLVLGNVWSLRGWADLSAVLLLSPLLLVGLGLFLILFALAAGVGWLIQWIPTAMKTVQQWLDAIDAAIRRISDVVTKPFLTLGSFAATIRAAVAALGKIIRVDEG